MSYQAVVGMFCLLFAIAILQSHQLRFASSCESHISSFTIKLNNETHTHTLTGASLLTTKPASTSAIFYWAQSQHCDPKRHMTIVSLSRNKGRNQFSELRHPKKDPRNENENWESLTGTNVQCILRVWGLSQSWQELVERTSARKKQAWHEFRYFRVRLWIGAQVNNK